MIRLVLTESEVFRMLKIKWVGIALILLCMVILIQWRIDDLIISLLFGMLSGFLIGTICMNCYINERYK